MSESDPSAGSFREGDPPLNAPTLASSGICKLCSKGTILRTKVYRMGGVGATVGYLLFILPALWVVLLIRYLGRPAPSGTELERALSSFGDDFVTAFLACFAFIGLVAGLLGSLLVLKKEVLKCSHCGVEVPRSVVGAAR
jgi:hypothetical protein